MYFCSQICTGIMRINLKDGSEKIASVARDFSRNIFILIWVFWFAGIITRFKILVWLAVVLLVVSWLTPGILLILNRPGLAQSWLRGLNSTFIPASPWEKLSSGKKFLVYINSLILSGFVVIAFIVYMIQWLQK